MTCLEKLECTTKLTELISVCEFHSNKTALIMFRRCYTYLCYTSVSPSVASAV